MLLLRSRLCSNRSNKPIKLSSFSLVSLVAENIVWLKNGVSAITGLFSDGIANGVA